MLPAQQTAPWQQTGAPWQRPLERESPAAPAEEGPIGIEVPPWDAPPPFSLEEPSADDPYDAYAPLPEDFAPARAALRQRMTAPVLERPATSGGDTRNSVFGDIFARSAPQPEPPPTPARREESAPPPADEPAAGQEFEAADDWRATAAPSAEQDSPAAPDPLEWPPVPTDFPPPDTQPTEYARQPSHDPLEWPPIPGELRHVPDRGTNGMAGTKSAVFEPPLAPTDQDPADTWPAPTGARLDEQPAAAESSWTPAAHAAESKAALFEPALPDSTDRASAPEAQAESLWAPEYGATEPALELTPISQPEPIGEQRGAVFARYAPQTMAPAVNVPADPTASAEQPTAVAQPAHAERTRHLWFLSRQAEEASAAAANTARATPSSVQTLILTVLVALGVIALVILFLAVFTSFFG